MSEADGPDGAGPSYVDSLLVDAKLVADYGMKAGLFTDDKLHSAIKVVREAGANQATSEQVKQLQTAMAEAMRKVPFATLTELRRGWRPGDGRESKRSLYWLLSVSILLMIVIGSLSQTYNRGVTLLSEIQALSVLDPSRQYGQLVRELVATRDALATMQPAMPTQSAAPQPAASQAAAAQPSPAMPASQRSTAPPPAATQAASAQATAVQPSQIAPGPIQAATTQPAAANIPVVQPTTEPPKAEIIPQGTLSNEERVKQNAYFRTFDDLKYLDATLASLSKRVEEFKKETLHPVFGSRVALYIWHKFWINLGFPSAASAKYVQSVDSDRGFLQDYDPPALMPAKDKNEETNILNITCPFLENDNNYISTQRNFTKERMRLSDNFVNMVEKHSLALSYLRCFEKFSSNENELPDLKSWLREINAELAPYNLWMLPSLFGMMGAIIFHLRLIANPLEPNPAPFRIIHRIAFGALAGMTLAWFWVPEVRFGIEVPDVGFGLFAMAFFVGFSLDIFFSMLDRFVALANTAVGNIGAKASPSG